MKKYSGLCKVLQIIIIIIVPICIGSLWLGLLLPIPWWLSWLICSVIFATGIYFFILSKKEFNRSRQKLTSKAQGTSRLMTAGIYSTIRHPHNLAILLINFGIAFLFKSIIGLIIEVTSVVLRYWFILEEEKLLVHQFGDRYREYKTKVPMLIPKFKKKLI